MNYLRYNLDSKPDTFEICLHHANCPDGIGGAFPFWKKNKNILLIGVRHSERIPLEFLVGKTVVIVDFCYSKKEIELICKTAKYVLILDHHDTSLREIKGLELDNLSYLFDTKRAASQIAWDFIFSTPRPWFIDIIADRDLWKWSVPHSKEIGKGLYHGGWYSLEKMEELEYSRNPERDRERFYLEGKILLEMEEKEISYSVRNSVLCRFEGYKVRVVTCNPSIRSEVGNRVANMDDCDFAVIWRYDLSSDQWWLSLRGRRRCKIALNQICEKYLGGGHTRACGFAIHGPRSREWHEAIPSVRKKMAFGCLSDYFTPLDMSGRVFLKTL